MDSEIKKKLRELLKQPHILLLGAGASLCADLPDLKGLGEGVETGLTHENLQKYLHIKKDLENKVIDEPSVEDIFSHIQISLELIYDNNEKEPLESLLADIKKQVAELVITEETTETHKLLVGKLKKRLSGLSLSDQRKFRYSVFTTNYDLLIEQACDANSVICVNGFIGKFRGDWVPSSFGYDISEYISTTKGKQPCLINNRINLYKMHGSITWQREVNKTIERIPPTRRYNVEIILPSSKKYIYTQFEPYERLFREFVEALNTGYSLLTIGYGFGDDHINQFIFEKLERSTNKVIALSRSPKPILEEYSSINSLSVVYNGYSRLSGKRYDINTDLWDFTKFVEWYPAP